MFFFGLALAQLHALNLLWVPTPETVSRGPAQIIHITEQRKLRHRRRLLRRIKMGY